jgi:hypothetical protein
MGTGVKEYVVPVLVPGTATCVPFPLLMSCEHVSHHCEFVELMLRLYR